MVERLEPRLLLTTIDLASLGAAGTTIFGADGGDRNGWSVSSAGDVNGDGFDDLIVGAPYADASDNAKSNAGESYVIFGGTSLSATIDLAALGTAGITIFGADAYDSSGRSVSAAGDVNGDGFDDLLIGASNADTSGNAKESAGESYVIFGGAALPTTIDLASLGTAGTTIVGADAGDRNGWSVSSAGDVNGDGFDDLLVGSPNGDGSGNAKYSCGDTYVIFGGTSLPSTIDLFNPLVARITITGADSNDSPRSVSGAGDVNGDGFDDLLVGAFAGDASGNAKGSAGDSYVIFGGAALPATIDLANLGTAGIKIFGAEMDDRSGYSVSGAGDVNGDGFDDLIVGAYYADASGNAKLTSGDSYVIFGGALLPTEIDLASLGAAGITIFGADSGDRSGRSVSSAGDVNGDGFDDLLIGAMNADGSGNAKLNAGDSYVIFGGATLPATIDLFSLGSAGITIFGADPADRSGSSVSSAGDVNGDGFDDLLIGVPVAAASGNAKLAAGDSYVIFGGDGFTGSVTHAGTSTAETLTGTAGANVMVGGGDNDTLVGSGGADVLIGGQGNDIVAVSDLTFKQIGGGTGTDTLRLDGSGLSLNLPYLADNLIQGIEQIDITGSGNNTLSLNLQEVLNISDESNTLVVRRNAGDVVNIGFNWMRETDEIIEGDAFHVFTQGAATLKVQNLSPVLATAAGITYTENDAPTAINSGITVADADNATLAGATVTISNFVAGQDVLGFTPVRATMGNIAIVSNAGGVLTLTSSGATATKAQWQTALRAVTYSNSSEDPTTTQRSVEFVVSEYTLDSNTLTSTINVTAANDVPVATASSVMTNEGTAKTFAASDFLFSDVEGNSLTSITVSGLSLASGDTLTVDQGAGAVAVTNGMTITAAQIATMIYTPAAGANGSPRSAFNFRVNDSDTGTVAATMNLNVTATPDALAIDAFDTTVGYTANAAAVLLDTNATVTHNTMDNFNTGVLTVSLTANAEAADRLEIRQVARLIGVSGSNVMYRGKIIGTLAGGVGTADLVITFNANATVSAVQALLRSVTYRSVSSNPSTVPRTVQVTLTDGYAGTSNAPTKTINVAAPAAPPQNSSPGATLSPSVLNSAGSRTTDAAGDSLLTIGSSVHPKSAAALQALTQMALATPAEAHAGHLLEGHTGAGHGGLLEIQSWITHGMTADSKLYPHFEWECPHTKLLRDQLASAFDELFARFERWI